MALAILIGIIVLFFLLIIFVPFVRSLIRGLIRLAFLIVVIFLAIAGTAMLMNNETIFDNPGWKKRATRFLTEDSAATSEKGYGEAPCALDIPAMEQRAKEEAKLKKGPPPAPASTQPSGQTTTEIAAQPTATPTPTQDEIEANLYDELMTRNYICEGDTPIAIGRGKLLEMVQQTITELKGWKLIGTDQRSGALNCDYASQVPGVESDVRILVTPRSDVMLCSRSKSGEPQSGSLLGFFPGDFGANMGHIKQFYAALKDKTDLYCKELEEKQTPKSPNR